MSVVLRMYTSRSDISREEYRSSKDLIDHMEVETPGLRLCLLKKLNQIQKCIDSKWTIIEVRYVCKVSEIHTYRTKETYDSKIRYMSYELFQSPTVLCMSELIEGKSLEEVCKPIDTRPKKEFIINACVIKYLEGEYPFRQSYTHDERTADNEVCKSVEVKYRTEKEYKSLCEGIYKDVGRLKPFCEDCGAVIDLWRFGPKNNRIYCRYCFEVKFNERPVAIEEKVYMRDYLIDLHEVPYAKYQKYVSKKHSDELESVLLNEANYVRGRKLLCSPKLEEISKTLKKTQNKRLHTLSQFYRQIILYEGDSTWVFEHTYLLANGVE